MEMLASNLRRFKVITFDCTNTLFYFKIPPHIKYIETAKSFGIPCANIDENVVKSNFKKHYKELSNKYPNFGSDSIKSDNWWNQLVINVFKDSTSESLDEKVLEAVAMKLTAQYKTPECWGKFDKTNDLINALKSIDKTVGIISNYDPPLHDLLRNMEIPKLDFVLTSYEVGIGKPNVEIFHRALEGRNVQPSEALHFGNELEKDYEGARNAGWSSILINSDAEAELKFSSIEDFWNVATTKELKI